MRSSIRLTFGLFVCGLVLGGFAAPAAADDMDIVTSFSDDDPPQYYEHGDGDPWAGWVNVTVTNSGDVAWGDFHFGIYDPIGGQFIDNVHFLDASTGGNDPTSSQSPLTWDIDNVVVGATIDLYYYDDPVLANETATFSVWTNNPDHVPFFGVMLYPTPVPEPGSLLLLGLGALLLRRK